MTPARGLPCAYSWRYRRCPARPLPTAQERMLEPGAKPAILTGR
jgi:hypothetical protein